MAVVHKLVDDGRHWWAVAERRAAERIAGAMSTGSAGGRAMITFDDGPDPAFTPGVLDVLARRRARATFFLVGEAARANPDLVRRIRDEGHTIGSHTRSHPDMWAVSRSEVRRQYLEGRSMVEEIIGADVPLVRPPKGWLDPTTSVMLRTAGFTTVLWSQDGADWVPDADVASILSTIGDVNDGSIILLHDALRNPESPAAADRTETVLALGALLDRLRGAGLEPCGMAAAD